MTKAQALDFLKTLEDMLHETDDPSTPPTYIDHALDDVFLAIRQAHWKIRAE